MQREQIISQNVMLFWHQIQNNGRSGQKLLRKLHQDFVSLFPAQQGCLPR